MSVNYALLMFTTESGFLTIVSNNDTFQYKNPTVTLAALNNPVVIDSLFEKIPMTFIELIVFMTCYHEFETQYFWRKIRRICQVYQLEFAFLNVSFMTPILALKRLKLAVKADEKVLIFTSYYGKRSIYVLCYDGVGYVLVDLKNQRTSPSYSTLQQEIDLIPNVKKIICLLNNDPSFKKVQL